MEPDEKDQDQHEPGGAPPDGVAAPEPPAAPAAPAVDAAAARETAHGQSHTDPVAYETRARVI